MAAQSVMTTQTLPEIGLAHLSLLHLDPDELVRVAAQAGYDFVGVRVRGATATETIADMDPGSAMSRAVRAAIDETGVRVRDIEFLSLDGVTDREQWLPMLEAGAAIGATTLSLAGQDTERDRLVESLGRLADDARPYGIVPTLEPISYNTVATVREAAAIARAAGAALLLDPLHIRRGGSNVADVADLEPELIPVLQLCDAPWNTPERIEVSAPLPRGMTADGEPRKVESRALRLPPSLGELPLTGLLHAAPTGVPISVEVPNAPMLEELGDLGFATRLHELTTAVLRAAAASAPSLSPAVNR